MKKIKEKIFITSVTFFYFKNDRPRIMEVEGEVFFENYGVRKRADWKIQATLKDCLKKAGIYYIRWHSEIEKKPYGAWIEKKNRILINQMVKKTCRDYWPSGRIQLSRCV